MQYIGDAKAGALVGKDQYARIYFAGCQMFTSNVAGLEIDISRTGIQRKKSLVSYSRVNASLLISYFSKAVTVGLILLKCGTFTALGVD